MNPSTMRARITKIAAGFIGVDDGAERLAGAVMDLIEGVPNRGYCKHCGRGDCTPTVEQYYELLRQVKGYRGMKNTYLRERNAAHGELLEADEIVSRLCGAIERLQALPRTPAPNPDGPPLAPGFQEGWETAILAGLAALDDGSQPKETR